MRNERGITLIDLLASIGIGLPVIAALISMITASLRVTYIANEQHHRALTTQRVEALSTIILGDIERHRLPLLPIIHSDGVLRYVDGSPLTVSSLQRKNRPSLDSTPITYLRLAMNQARWVTQRYGSEKVKACRTVSSEPPPPILRGALAIGPDGIEEMKMEILQGNLLQPCITISMTRHANSMITRTKMISLESASLIVPIESVYSYFVSEDGELRLLSHSGARIIEHQPVHDGIHDMRISSITNKNLGIVTFSLAISTNGIAKVHTSFSPRFSRISLDEVLTTYSALF